MAWLTCGRATVVVFLSYMVYNFYALYLLFYPQQCSIVAKNENNCLRPFLKDDAKLSLQIYTSVKSTKQSIRKLSSIYTEEDFHYHKAFTKSVNVTLPSAVVKNGTLFAHIVIYPYLQMIDGHSLAYTIAPLTRYAIPKADTQHLLSSSIQNRCSSPLIILQTLNRPKSHWKKTVSVRLMTEKFLFDMKQFPAEIFSLLRLTNGDQYLPFLHVTEMSQTLRQAEVIDVNTTVKVLHIDYQPISVGALRFWVSMEESMKLIRKLGFSDNDIDKVKGIFSSGNLKLLLLTFVISLVHVLLDFLAFKNDVNFWKGRKTTAGLSPTTVIWHSFSYSVIFLYLLDEDASYLVIVPLGISTIIEIWKLAKVFKVTLERKPEHWLPSIQFGQRSKAEQESESYDLEAIRYLSYFLYPLVLIGAIYCLIYNSYKSWYSWILHSLVNGIYAFGFLFMLPQLFINYKLKSVAHLPWRAFMYKAFNTFIDDVFAFIIIMPTSHRLAVFRDDFVFLIYLYQRWLYPVDKSRVNEFGMSYEDKESKPHSD
ncbi:uncharacterized protein TRIADDRAFT_24450 [Trichoplax adhaerens]|uniref:Lipid scramblase CLPTM1L n=1 Tax=Trichoplax adhaerens TaxID=10228 RepID=B3RV52_TRIAD|nr:hypothetical protein TRIADDRAFT_24450 [Trichoplax adhaerens]EDV25935.1 hypothetical protein TRIADDRAFT_24450 [Trichoplax adhaerens]|eukprot:XP_002111968.1 hypothetical protein TRIADDRAFT_24450 [Trichoplax adhaerens]